MRGWVAISDTATPAAAPSRIREVLRIIREPPGLHLRPTMAWIDLNPVLTELNVEYALVCTARLGKGQWLGAPALRRTRPLPRTAPSQWRSISASKT
jgi:hypothetical protein